VQRAVDASRPETSTQIADSRIGSRDVSESQNDYCDVAAKAELDATGVVVLGIKLWVPLGESRELASGPKTVRAHGR
jgi:hypothetical protein